MKRKILAILLVLCMTVGALVSCSDCTHEKYTNGVCDKCGEKCTHSYQDGVCTICKLVCTNHTYVNGACSTCKKACAHSYQDGYCSVCGAEDPNGAQHTLIDFDSVFGIGEITIPETFGITLTDISVTGIPLMESSLNYALDMELFKIYIGLDSKGNLIGYCNGTLNVANDDINIDNDVEFSGFIETVTNDDGIGIAGLYLVIDGAIDNESSEEKLAYISLDAEALFEKSPELAEAREALAMAESYLPEIEAWYNEEVAPIVEALATLIGSVNIDTDSFMQSVVDALFTKTVDGDTLIHTLDFEFIDEWKSALEEKKISELIDMTFGENTFANIELNMSSFLNFKVGDVVDFLEENDIVAADLFAALDSLAAIIAGADGITFEQLIGLEGIDISAMLEDEALLGFSVIDALVMLANTPAEPVEEGDEVVEITKEDMLASINGILLMLKDSTVYDLLLLDDAAIDEVNTAIDAVVEQLQDTVFCEFTIDKDGKLIDSSLVISLTIPEGEGTNAIDATVAIYKDAEVAEFSIDLVGDEEIVQFAIIAEDGVITVWEYMSADDTAVDITINLIPDYQTTVDTDLLNRVKAAAKTSYITYDNYYQLLDYDYDLLPMFEEGSTEELVGMAGSLKDGEAVSYDYELLDVIENSDGSYVAMYRTWEDYPDVELLFENIYLTSVVSNCGDWQQVTLMFFAEQFYYEYEEVYDAEDNLISSTEEEALAGVPAGTMWNSFSLRFYYNTETKEIANEDQHSFEIEESEYITANGILFCHDVYSCPNCEYSFDSYDELGEIVELEGAFTSEQESIVLADGAITVTTGTDLPAITGTYVVYDDYGDCYVMITYDRESFKAYYAAENDMDISEISDEDVEQMLVFMEQPQSLEMTDTGFILNGNVEYTAVAQ